MFIFRLDDQFTDEQKEKISEIAGVLSFVNFILFTIDDAPHLCIFDPVNRHFFVSEELKQQYTSIETKDAGSFHLHDGKFDVIGGGGTLGSLIDRDEAEKWRVWMVDQYPEIIRDSWEKFLEENTIHKE
jgi:hypothetical protein